MTNCSQTVFQIVENIGRFVDESQGSSAPTEAETSVRQRLVRYDNLKGVPTIPLNAGPAALRKLKGNLLKAAGRSLYSAGIRGVSVLQTQLIPGAVPAPVDRALYKAGWRCDPHLVGDHIAGCDIYNVEPYASIIERGARASNIKVGRAMIDALAEWAKRKRLKGAKKSARSIAWAIAMSMKKKGIFNRNGTEGLHLLEKLITERMPAIYQAEFEREVRAMKKT